MSSTAAAIKKKESIAEYIIYMYQTEDLILNYKFNLDDIFEYVIRHMSQNEQVLKAQLLWYADLIEQMRNEGILNGKKRLSTTQEYVIRLTSLHERLVNTDKKYQPVFFKAENDIQHHVALSENTILSPIQICLNGIYGMLLLKLNGKTVSDEQQSTLVNFGNVLEYLSEAYKKEFPQSK